MHRNSKSEVATRPEPVRLTQSMIPTSSNFDVLDSRFFRKWDKLPSPEEVRTQAKVQHLTGAQPELRINSPKESPVRPPPALFDEYGLFVKWGKAVKLSEAQCLYTLGRLFESHVPVPQVYGWRVDSDETFIYMEHIQGQTLEQAWDILGPGDRVSVCYELRTIIDNPRQLEQDPLDLFIANIVRKHLYDRAFHIAYMLEAGPFDTVKDFHNWFKFLHRRPMPDPFSVPVEPFRQDLPDSSAIKFTHKDLHRSNILITPTKPYRILAIIDWEQSGWLPEYWEARKAQYTADRDDEWSTKYLPLILDQYASTWDPWDYYTIGMGC